MIKQTFGKTPVVILRMLSNQNLTFTIKNNSTCRKFSLHRINYILCYYLSMPEAQEIPAVKPSGFRSAWEAIKNFRRGKEKIVPTLDLPKTDNQQVMLETEEPNNVKPEIVPDISESTVEEDPVLNTF